MVEGDGLGEVDGEAGGLAAGDVLVASETAECDRVEGAVLAERAHQVPAGAVGEADVTQEQVELLGRGGREGGADVGGGGDAVAVDLEQLL